MSEETTTGGNGLRDKWFWGALAVALLIRVLPLLLWPSAECTRDECIFQKIADKIVDGQGLTTSKKGWLPAPGYPYMLAWSEMIFGTMQALKWFQLALGGVGTWLMYRIGSDVGDQNTGRISAWLYAVHPTLAFFVGTHWTETVYHVLLLGGVAGVLWARKGDPMRTAVAALALAGCVLFRGVATYLAPIFVLALLWPDEALSRASIRAAFSKYWRHAAAFVVVMALALAPYSLYASKRFGGFMVTDATLGHVIYLGNNTFEPVTFDYGNGMLTGPVYSRVLKSGRRPCPRRVPPVQSSKCEVNRALKYIRNEPGLFLSRVPLRTAQMFNPHSFMSRHIRWGFWPGLPWIVKEFLVFYVALTTAYVVLVGTVAAWARAGGSYGVLAVGTIVYHLFTIAIMYGMTRFRLPLEPLWMVYVALLLSDPKGTAEALRASPLRLLGAIACLPILLYLMAWFAPTGWPWFW